MSAITGNRVETTEKTLVFHRTFNAPIEVVFAMFGGDHVGEWWAPKPYRCVTNSMDFRQGGNWQYSMVMENGTPTGSNVITTYDEIVPPSRIVMSDYFIDEEGNKIRNDYNSTKTIDLVEHDGVTELTLRSEYPTEEGLQAVHAMGMVEGMGIALDQLHALVEAQ